MNRRKLLKTVAGSGALLAIGASPALAQNKTSRIPVDLSHRKIPKIKITKLDTIMTGRDVYVRIETDAGIVGYGDATNHFLPYSRFSFLKLFLEKRSPCFVGRFVGAEYPVPPSHS